jgi:hypothetical protein
MVLIGRMAFSHDSIEATGRFERVSSSLSRMRFRSFKGWSRILALIRLQGIYSIGLIKTSNCFERQMSRLIDGGIYIRRLEF